MRKESHVIIEVVDYRLTVTTTGQGSMKTVFALAIAFSFVSVTVAVTITVYAGSGCTGPLYNSGGPGGFSNPTVYVLGVCTANSGSPSFSSTKFTNCGTTATGIDWGRSSAPDTTCSIGAGESTTLPVGQCFGVSSGQSFMVTCASGTSITLALVSVAVAVLSFCL